jgi:protocatechuate 3,4-dioxygenase beta subunit
MVVRKLALTLTLVTWTALLLAQNPPQSTPPQQQQQQQQQQQPEPCTVSGRVVSAADGTPLQSARVGLVQADHERRPAVYGTATDANGHFEIKDVPPGRYRFMAAHTGFISQEYQAKGLTGGAVLSLSPGQTVDDVIFRLTRAAAVSGRVADESGEPMMGVVVSTLRKPTPEEEEEWHHSTKREHLMQSGSAVTDDRGEYRVFGLKPGEYYLKATESPDEAFTRMQGVDVQMDDYELVHEMASHYAPLYYPGVLQTSEAQAIQLQAGGEMQADFTMRHVKTVQVSGHVVGADGKPATHAFVGMRVPDVDDWGSDLSGTTDEKGEFIIKGVAPGSYIISAQQRTENRRDTAHQKLEVGDSSLENVVLSFGSGITINGRITAAGSGVAFDRAHVVLTSVEEDPVLSAWAEVKADGTFELTNVADGSYILRAGVSQRGWYVKSARMGATDVLQKGVQIEGGAAGGTLEIVLSSATAQLDGAVTQDNKPVVGAQIRVRPDPETPYNRLRGTGGETDQNGHFVVPDVPPGKYKVTAKLPSGTPEVPALTSDPQIITLGEHDHQTVQLELPKPEQ